MTVVNEILILTKRSQSKRGNWKIAWELWKKNLQLGPPNILKTNQLRILLRGPFPLVLTQVLSLHWLIIMTSQCDTHCVCLVCLAVFYVSIRVCLSSVSPCVFFVSVGVYSVSYHVRVPLHCLMTCVCMCVSLSTVSHTLCVSVYSVSYPVCLLCLQCLILCVFTVSGKR